MTVEIPAATVHGKRVAGRIIVTVKIPEIYEDAVMMLAQKVHEQRISQLYVKLALPRKPRTTGWKSQNHAINGFVQQICDYTGEDFWDVKLYAKRKAMRRGLPPMLNDNGDIVYSRNDGEPMPMSESDMDTKQASWVIDELYIIADEIKLVLVDAEKNGGTNDRQQIDPV